MDDDFEKRIEALEKYLDETPKEEIDAILSEIKDCGSEGPTVEEYFNSMNPSYNYDKGYTDAAKKLKDLLIEKFTTKNDSQDMILISEVIEIINKIYKEN